MNYQTILYKKYNETRSIFLDQSDNEKLEWFDQYFQSMYKNIFNTISKNASILELGCNKGYLLRILSNNGFQNLCGVDLSEYDLNTARSLVPEAKLHTEDIFSFLTNHHQSFDVIILKALIEHIKKDDVFSFLEKINSSLRDNGIVLIDVQNSAWIFGLHDRYVDFTHEIGFTRESLRQIMLLFFENVQVNPQESPLYKMSKKAKLRHYIAKKVLFTLLKWAEPETPYIKERILIGLGNKKNE